VWCAALVAPAMALTTLAPASASAPLTHDDSAAIGVTNSAYIFGVTAVDGDSVALATRLDAAGYEVVGMDGETVRVFGDAAVGDRLRADAGLTVVASENVSYAVPATEPAGSQDPILPKKLDGKKYQTFYGGYRTVDAYHQFEDDLGKAYPKLVKVMDYGKSWTKDNPLRVVCITADADKGCKLSPNTDKARFLLMAQIHAREITTSEITWRFMTSLIDGYKHDAQATALLDSTEVWVVPETNPDGIETVQKGIKKEGTGYDSPAYQRKTMNDTEAPPEGCPPPWANSHAGIDSNRNYDSHYGGASTSPDPCSEVYKGTGPDSEPETRGIEDLAKNLFKDQRGPKDDDPAPDNTTGAMLTLHSVAGLVLLPWGYSAAVQTPNDAGLRSMAFRASYFNHYRTGQPGQVLYNASGTTDDWMYDKLGIASFTWEMGPGSGDCDGFLPAYHCQDAFFALNEPALYYTATAARAPYMYGQGPTTMNVKAKAKGGKVSIKATSDDDAYGAAGVGRPTAKKVTDGRIYVGKAPWDGGKAKALKVKGSGTTVKLTGKVKAGKTKQLAYVQGKDADGNWGPIAAVWIPKK
jgi:hypothetical protein